MNDDSLSFCLPLQEMITSGEVRNAKGEAIPLVGTSTVNNLLVIRECLKQIQATQTLETGLAQGASALAILATLKEVVGDEFQHTAIDPFQTSDFGGSAVEALELAELGENFRLVEKPSALALPQFIEQREKFQFVYIDGSHLFEDVFTDFYFSSQLLEVGGVVLFDDCTTGHVKKVIRFIRKNYSGILKPLNLGPYQPFHKPLLKRVVNAMGYRQLAGFTKIFEPPRHWTAEYNRF